MSAIPHLSNAYHSRMLRLSIEREIKEGPPPGGKLKTLSEAVKSVRLPIGFEFGEKLISITNTNPTIPSSDVFFGKN